MTDPRFPFRSLSTGLRKLDSASTLIGLIMVVAVLVSCGGDNDPLEERPEPTQTAETQDSSPPTTTTGKQDPTETPEAEVEQPGEVLEEREAEADEVDIESRFVQLEIAADGSITITGRGPGVTESFELGEATWELNASVTNNLDTFTQQAAFVFFDLVGDDFDDDRFSEMLGVEEAESGEWTETVEVGFGLFVVEPGYFFVDASVTDGAEWTFKLTPDQVPPTTTIPAEPRETFSFTGTGPTITDQVEVTAGWWRYEFTIEGNTETINGVEQQAFASVVADVPNMIYLIFYEEADAGIWTQTDNLGGEEPGIWHFEITVAPDATWSLTMTPLER